MGIKEYTVKQGDSLYTIAESILHDGTRWPEIADKIKPIMDKTKPYVYIGQKIDFSSFNITTCSPPPQVTSPSQPARIDFLGNMANSNNTLLAVWAWDVPNTEHFEVEWDYGIWPYGEDLNCVTWISGSTTTVDKKLRQNNYSVPDEAIVIRFRVKPIAENKSEQNDNGPYWTSVWSNYRYWYHKDLIPTTPATPTVEATDKWLHISLNNLKVNATHIAFECLMLPYVTTENATPRTGSVPYNYIRFVETIDNDSCQHTLMFDNNGSLKPSLQPNANYIVRASAIRSDGRQSPWSDFSSIVLTKPDTIDLTTLTFERLDPKSVKMDWGPAPVIFGSMPLTYDIEYSNKDKLSDDFGHTASGEIKTVSGVDVPHYIFRDLEYGTSYSIRIRGSSGDVKGSWSNAVEYKYGEAPDEPTAWAINNTVNVNGPVTVYWVHNPKDGSKDTKSKIRYRVVQSSWGTMTEEILAPDDPMNLETIRSFTFRPSLFDGKSAEIRWSVCTAGVTGEYGPYSKEQSLFVYKDILLGFALVDDTLNPTNDSVIRNGNYWFFLKTNPQLQTPDPINKPNRYTVKLYAAEPYDYIDDYGINQHVNTDDLLYTWERTGDITQVFIRINPSDIFLPNNTKFYAVGQVYSNIGAGMSIKINVKTNYDIVSDLDVRGKITYDSTLDEALLAITSISPKTLIARVYRRTGTKWEFLTKTSLATQITTVHDSHPSLKMLEYAVVAIDTADANIKRIVVGPKDININKVIIQWNTDANVRKLVLDTNLSITYKNITPNETVKYLGRSNPVTYYADYTEQSVDISSEIATHDTKRLELIKELSLWDDVVYIRERGGDGYYASVTVDYEYKYLEVITSVKITATKTEGGMQ